MSRLSSMLSVRSARAPTASHGAGSLSLHPMAWAGLISWARRCSMGLLRSTDDRRTMVICVEAPWRSCCDMRTPPRRARSMEPCECESSQVLIDTRPENPCSARERGTASSRASLSPQDDYQYSPLGSLATVRSHAQACCHWPSATHAVAQSLLSGSLADVEKVLGGSGGTS